MRFQVKPRLARVQVKLIDVCVCVCCFICGKYLVGSNFRRSTAWRRFLRFFPFGCCCFKICDVLAAAPSEPEPSRSAWHPISISFMSAQTG